MLTKLRALLAEEMKNALPEAGEIVVNELDFDNATLSVTADGNLKYFSIAEDETGENITLSEAIKPEEPVVEEPEGVDPTPEVEEKTEDTEPVAEEAPKQKSLENDNPNPDEPKPEEPEQSEEDAPESTPEEVETEDKPEGEAEEIAKQKALDENKPFYNMYVEGEII